MSRLQSRIEDVAFGMLYPRQYRAAQKLYYTNNSNERENINQTSAAGGGIAAWKTLARYLEQQVEQVLFHDESKLRHQIEEWQVVSRVKQPYSAWKKLLRQRFRKSLWTVPQTTTTTGSSEKTPPNSDTTTAAAAAATTSTLVPTRTTTSFAAAATSELSLLDLHDGVALRIILRARKLTDDETDAETEAREQILCYYVQHLLQQQWPVMDPSRVKDYVRTPKPNGYQSLHYASAISSQGKVWPFEIQVRSLNMHRFAEYGVAAHWDYKLGGGGGVRNNSSPPRPPIRTLLPSSSGTSANIKNPIVSPLSSSSSSSPYSSNYIDALVLAQKDLRQSQVFVFFVDSGTLGNNGAGGRNRGGHLLSLSVGARVYDALVELERMMMLEQQHTHSEYDDDDDDDLDDSSGKDEMVLSDSMKSAKLLRNGRVVTEDEFVGNGDVLWIQLK